MYKQKFNKTRPLQKYLIDDYKTMEERKGRLTK